MNAAVSLKGVCKSYDGRDVLCGVDLDAFEGEILCLLGPNGAGKTTILRIMNLLVKPDSGERIFFGEDVTCNAGIDVRRRMAMVFQRPVVFNASVYDNVAYGLRIRGVGRDDVRRRVDDALCDVGIGDVRRNALSLSGGEAQRVALARALVIEPQVVFLDEPTSNLDPLSVGIFEDAVRKMNKEHGTTIVMATHNIFQAKRLSSRVVFLSDGGIVEEGRREDIFSAPKDERLKRFLCGEIG